MKKPFYFCIVFIVLAFSSACTKLPQSHLKYVGIWSSGTDYEIILHPNGHGYFKTKSISGNALITATKEGFKIGFGPFQRVYNINQEPYKDKNGDTFFIANDLIYKKKNYTEIEPTLEVEIKTDNLEKAENTKIDLKYIEQLGALQSKTIDECAKSALYSRYVGHWISDTEDILIIFPNCVSFFKGAGRSFSGSTVDIDTSNRQLRFIFKLKPKEETNNKQEQLIRTVMKFLDGLMPKMVIKQEPVDDVMILDDVSFHKLKNNNEFPIKTKVVLELQTK